MKFTAFAVRNRRVEVDVWHGAPSCCVICSFLTIRGRPTLRILWYYDESTCFSHLIKMRKPSHRIAPQTMIWGENFVVLLIILGSNLFPGLCRTYSRCRGCNCRTHSSVKTIRFHCAWFQTFLLAHHSLRFRICLGVRKGFLIAIGLLPKSLFLLREHFTVSTDTQLLRLREQRSSFTVILRIFATFTRKFSFLTLCKFAFSTRSLQILNSQVHAVLAKYFLDRVSGHSKLKSCFCLAFTLKRFVNNFVTKV